MTEEVTVPQTFLPRRALPMAADLDEQAGGMLFCIIEDAVLYLLRGKPCQEAALINEVARKTLAHAGDVRTVLQDLCDRRLLARLSDARVVHPSQRSEPSPLRECRVAALTHTIMCYLDDKGLRNQREVSQYFRRFGYEPQDVQAALSVLVEQQMVRLRPDGYLQICPEQVLDQTIYNRFGKDRP